MQTTEVTQGQWKAVMGNNPSYYDTCGDECPVENVSWEDAQEFIRKVNRTEGKNVYRLPTEAEWEYAARAGSTTAFANGDMTQGSCDPVDTNLNAMGWYCGNSGSKPHQVKKKKPNVWGVYDMHGNVYEWCQDWYGSYPDKPVIDPKGPDLGSSRVFRGGAWNLYARFCRSAHRGYDRPGDRGAGLGFRLARSLP